MVPDTRILISVLATCHDIGVGRTKVYELIRSGDLDSVKIDNRRLVVRESIERFVERLSNAEKLAASLSALRQWDAEKMFAEDVRRPAVSPSQADPAQCPPRGPTEFSDKPDQALRNRPGLDEPNVKPRNIRRLP